MAGLIRGRLRLPAIALVLILVPVWLIGWFQLQAQAAGCGLLDLTCQAGSLVGSFIDMLAKAFVEGVATVVKAITAFWLVVPTPQVASDAAGTPTGPVAFLQSSVGAITELLATVGFAIGLAKVAWAHHTGSRGREVQNIVRQIITLIAVQGGGLAGIWAFIAFGDSFALWIIARSTGNTDFGANMATVLGFTVATGIGAVVLAFMAFLDVIAGIGQLFMMLARGGALVIAAGMWPVAASFRGTTEYGEQFYRKMTAWIIGLIAYRPAAGIVYATAFQLIGQKAFGDNGLVYIITGLVMLVIATVAPLALMKFAVPLVAAANLGGGGSGHAGGGAAVVAGGAAIVSGYVTSGAPSGGHSPSSSAPSGAIPSGGVPMPAAPSGAGGAAAGAAGGPAGAAVSAGASVVSGAVNGVRNTGSRATGESS